MLFFFFNDTATTEIYTLSLHDALPISVKGARHRRARGCGGAVLKYQKLGKWGVKVSAVSLGSWLTYGGATEEETARADRKSTRLNSSHANISYAVFCLKKKKTIYLEHE